MRFLSEAWTSTLKAMGLVTFEDWWQCKAGNVEKPNTKPGKKNTWSKVSAIQTPDGKTLYLKRQKNFYPNNLLQRWRKELTFEREYQNYQKIHHAGVPTYSLVYFESRKSGNNREAIYLAEGLDGFTSLEHLMPIWKKKGWPPREDRQQLLTALLQTVKKMHHAGILHNALSPRHLFFNISTELPYSFPETIEIRLIDFERLKELKPGSDKGIKRDLFSMHRRGKGWPNRDRVWFLKQYLGINKLDDKAKTIIRNLTREAARRDRR